MELYTIQIAKWRLAKKQNIEFIDTTVKSGVAWLAPTWDIVSNVKDGTITPEQYTEVYNRLMIESMFRHESDWYDLLNKNKVAIACYCADGNFCHRHILKRIIKNLCFHYSIPYVDGGEIT